MRRRPRQARRSCPRPEPPKSTTVSAPRSSYRWPETGMRLLSWIREPVAGRGGDCLRSCDRTQKGCRSYHESGRAVPAAAPVASRARRALGRLGSRRPLHRTAHAHYICKIPCSGIHMPYRANVGCECTAPPWAHGRGWSGRDTGEDIVDIELHFELGEFGGVLALGDLKPPPPGGGGGGGIRGEGPHIGPWASPPRGLGDGRPPALGRAGGAPRRS